MIAEAGMFRIFWSRLKPAASQHERELRLQVYERDDEDYEHRRQQEEEDDWYVQQQEEEDY